MRAFTPLEISSGLVLPPRRRPPRLPELPAGATPRSEFERAILPALSESPCLVSFSGGRDSSAVLATAARVARREGLPLPVPITHRFPSASDTQETEWQEQVIRHLGLDDWVRIDAAGDLDCVVGETLVEAAEQRDVDGGGNAVLLDTSTWDPAVRDRAGSGGTTAASAATLRGAGWHVTIASAGSSPERVWSDLVSGL